MNEIKREMIRPASLNKNERSVEVVIATENPAEVFDPLLGINITEILLMEGVELSPDLILPLTFEHKKDISSVIGSVKDLKVKNKELIGTAYFSEAEESIYKKVSEGHLRNLSVTYYSNQRMNLKENEKYKNISAEKDLILTTKWTPISVGLVLNPADKNAIIRGKNNMEKTINNNEIIETERNRTATIFDLCSRSKCEHLAEKMIKEGVSIEDATKQILSAMITERNFKEQIPLKFGMPPIGSVSITADEIDKRNDAIIDGLCSRAGLKLEKPAPGFEYFRNSSLMDICREVTGATKRMSNDEVVRKALQRSHTTSDFPFLLANTGNKILRKEYELLPSTFEQWVQVTAGNDFKEMSRNQLSEAPDIAEVAENEEYTFGTFGESKEVFFIKKYGKMFSISREAIINDDLNAFMRIPKAFSLSAKRKINESVYDILINNANMGDGIPLFNASHYNLEAVETTLPTIASLTSARLAMRTQKGLSGKTINVIPKFIIVPAALETYTEQVLFTDIGYDPTAGEGLVNPFFKKFELIVEPYLDNSSAKIWYLIADNRSCDTVELCFLNGQQAPYLESKEGFEVDGITYKIRHEFGVKAIDYRGLYMNPGE